MTIQQVIANEQEINTIELSKQKNLEGFEKFYSEDVVIVQSDGETFTGKAACREMEEGFNAGIITITDKKLISSVAMVSPDKDYEFLVVATWYYDLDTAMYPIKGTQTSLTYWKNDLIQKVVFNFPAEVIA